MQIAVQTQKKRHKRHKRPSAKGKVNPHLLMWNKALKRHGLHPQKGKFTPAPKKGTMEYKNVRRTYDEMKIAAGAPRRNHWVYPASGNKPKGMTMTEWTVDPKNKSRTRELYSGPSGKNEGSIGGSGGNPPKRKNHWVYPASGNKPKGMTMTEWTVDPKNKSRTRELYSGPSGKNEGSIGGSGGNPPKR